MKRSESFYIFILALVILYGSILNIHVHSDQLNNTASESSKEIENSSIKGKELLFVFNFFLINASRNTLVTNLSSPLVEVYFPKSFTTSQLLKSNRIALPPPSYS